ncbi:18352_t:CDS:2, partial [Racocetra persica]
MKDYQADFGVIVATCYRQPLIKPYPQKNIFFTDSENFAFAGQVAQDFGVRLFSVPEEPENKKSLAEKRRGFRSQRRLLNRWHCRREDLKKFFGKIFGSDFLQEFENFAKKSTNFLPADLEKYEEESEFFNPYVVSSEEKEVKEAQTAVRKTEKLFQEKKYETVAEM